MSALGPAGAVQPVALRGSAYLVRRRFFRHRAALAGLVVLAGVVLLAFSSIGFGPVPGWWGLDYSSTGLVVDRGRMSLDVLPPFLDGDWFAFGPHPFGQSNTGADYFALTMRGTQQSLVIAFTVGALSTALGVLVGVVAGYFRGWVETVLMRLTDVVLTVPLFVIGAVLARSVAGRGVFALALALGLLQWYQLARMLRAEILSLREQEFVLAAVGLGASPARIMTRELLPNTVGTVVVNATLITATAILLETTLSFLGLGVRPPDTSLGQLVSVYQDASQTRPWLFWWPGLFIVAITLSVNFVGDGLRDAFDPRSGRAGAARKEIR
ncbi:ABC transporter permease [Spongisporangium articulatum]|uniref:ABC transporter permease n=1 Tax=Spongisporangium articulatum TaxID=3362603 RepID=A0ABW8AQ87_9ACTN